MPTLTPGLVGFEGYSFFHDVAGKAYIPQFDRTDNETLLSQSLQSLKKWKEKLIFDGFPRREAAVILGMIFGNTNLLDRKLKDQFILS
jgi:hypothetical protein